MVLYADSRVCLSLPLHAHAPGYTRGAQVEGAGITLRQFDKNNAVGDPWMPCAHGEWCAKFSDRWSTVIVNALAPHLYSDYGGFVLDPKTTRLFCACACTAPHLASTARCAAASIS
jgi:hypothetical protein